MLVVGGGFAGYAVAKNLCRLTKRRDDIGVMVINRENFMTFWPMVPHDGRRGLTVDTYRRVKGHDNVWGIGDCAANVDENGDPVPPNARAVVQQGEAGPEISSRL